MTFSIPFPFVGDISVVIFLLTFIALMFLYWIIKFVVTIFMGG